MAWLKFDQLNPAQSVVAQRHLAAHAETIPALKRPRAREYLIVDGELRGSRVLLTEKGKKLFDVVFPPQPRSKADLRDWKSTPTPFSLDEK